MKEKDADSKSNKTKPSVNKHFLEFANIFLSVYDMKLSSIDTESTLRDIITSYALVAGCDYGKFEGVSGATAVQIVNLAVADFENFKNDRIGTIAKFLYTNRPSKYRGSVSERDIKIAEIREILTCIEDAFLYPLVWNSQQEGLEHLTSLPDDKKIESKDLEIFTEIVQKHIMGLIDNNEEEVPNPTDVQCIHIPGDLLPTQLLFHMVPGSRPSLAPEHATVTIAELQDELKRARLSTDGDIEELRQRAIDHELMIRKSPDRLTGAEC